MPGENPSVTSSVLSSTHPEPTPTPVPSAHVPINTTSQPEPTKEPQATKFQIKPILKKLMQKLKVNFNGHNEVWRN